LLPWSDPRATLTGQVSSIDWFAAVVIFKMRACWWRCRLCRSGLTRWRRR
jgi:radical SAM superfamily enzyme YgiQ (UPF0313 family)